LQENTDAALPAPAAAQRLRLPASTKRERGRLQEPAQNEPTIRRGRPL
jgi:hypothetical protein